MKYLAFDIEAANGYKSYSVCSIGIVVANEDFEVESKRNILINPMAEYNLNGKRKNITIDLRLNEDELKKSPLFPEVYDEIKELLENPDHIIIGHAVESDVYMLNSVCKHYNLPCINYNFICTQLLYKLYYNHDDIRALNKIADDLNIEFLHHASDEDALMSLYTLKYLLTETKLSLELFLEKYKVRIGRNENYDITRTVSLMKNDSIKSLRKEKEIELCDYIKTIGKVENKLLEGVVIAFSRELEIFETDKVKDWIYQIYKKGGVYTTKIGKCNVYIYNENPGPSDATREAYIKAREEKGYTILKINYEDFDVDGLKVMDN